MNILSAKHHPANYAWTIFELMAVMFVVFVPILLGQYVAKGFGFWPGIGSGILSSFACIGAVVLFYRASRRRFEQRRRELREKYRRIYRVISLPADEMNIRKPQGAEIQVGDYGWEAEPMKGQHQLIYLQGLTEQWQVVWYAGFRSDQIESVSVKPRSQYDWDYSWIQHPPECPYPIQKGSTTSMGLPNVYGWNGWRRK